MTAMDVLRRDLLHLTWRGRASMAYYALRRFFVVPVVPADRCFMGAPVGEHVHCPRHTHDGSLWCHHHTPYGEKDA